MSTPRKPGACAPPTVARIGPVAATVLAGAAALFAGQRPAPHCKSLVITTADISVRFDRAKAWNINRIEHEGVRLGIDKPGAHYGTVFRFPGVGFIGTGHTENETEEVLSLEAEIDGNPIGLGEDGAFTGVSARLHRVSRIRALSLESTTIVGNARLSETVVITTKEKVPLSLVYLFMHPWTVSATHYLAGKRDGTRVSGAFTDDRGFRIGQEMEWVAVYDRPSGKAVVSCLLARPQLGGGEFLLWDVPKTYRKFYLRCFRGSEIPAGFVGTYRMTTAFIAAVESEWQEKAQELAREIFAQNEKADGGSAGDGG